MANYIFLPLYRIRNIPVFSQFWAFIYVAFMSMKPYEMIPLQRFRKGIKSGFHMIADDRRRSRIANCRSQTIANRVVSIWSQTIASDRRADCYIHFGQRKCQNLIHARNHSKQNGGRRGRNFAASKFILTLVNRFSEILLAHLATDPEGSVSNRFR